MKNIKKTLLMTATCLLAFNFTSCNTDDFLDVDHYDILPADVMFKDEASAEEGLNGVYDILFPDADYAVNWNYKPQLFLCCHPTLDTQAIGWDVQWCVQNWRADDSDLKSGWLYLYRGIDRCNNFLEGLEDENVKKFSNYKHLEGEARAIRAYLYMFLAENWGKVPMLNAGETYLNTPDKANAATDDEEWDFIIEDLKAAAEDLDWKPYNNEYGRCTKGMALSYLGEAYLWKAYKARVNGDGNAKSTENIQLAKNALEEVINSGTYELSPSYGTLWDADEAWSKEAIWQVVMDMGEGNYGTDNSDAHVYSNFSAASTNGGGGWGSEYLSWELYLSYEPGDRRRDASMCTSPVPDMPERFRGKYTYGYNPFLQQWLGRKSKDGNTNYKGTADDLDTNNGWMTFNGGTYAPAVWSMKYWRLQRCQWINPFSPCHYYYKRYSGVLLDYAECLFRLNGGNDATAWGIINQIRNRAFGNLEVSQASSLDSKFTTYYKSLAGKGGYDDYVAPEHYPIPFQTEKVKVPDAKEYYSKYITSSEVNGIEDFHKPFTGCEAWQVALLQERRKEFNSEWNLKADIQRSDMLEKHIECDYPKGKGKPNTDTAKANDWHYYRDWDFNPQRLLMPIPTDEILKNKFIKQNPGY